MSGILCSITEKFLVKKQNVISNKYSKKAGVVMALAIAFIFTTCQTYHITTKSLIEQLANTQKEKKVNFIVAFPIFFPGIVAGNSLREVSVLDKMMQYV